MSLEVSLSIFAPRTKDSLTEPSTICYFPSTLCFQPATHHTSPFYYPCTHSCKSEGCKNHLNRHTTAPKDWVCVGWWVSAFLQCMTMLWVSVTPNWSNMLLWLSLGKLSEVQGFISSPERAPTNCSVSEMKFYSIISYFLSCHKTECNFKTCEELIWSLNFTKIDFVISIVAHYHQISK